MQMVMSLPTASDASRVLDEALFCMDEDGTKTPLATASPDTLGLSPPRPGMAAPATPSGAAILVTAATFASPPTATRDSLAASFESMSLHVSLPGGTSAAFSSAAGTAAAAGSEGGSSKPMSPASAAASAFAGPSTYLPGFSDGRPSQQRPKLRRRRPVMGNRLRKRLPAEVRASLCPTPAPPPAAATRALPGRGMPLLPQSLPCLPAAATHAT